MNLRVTPPTKLPASPPFKSLVRSSIIFGGLAGFAPALRKCKEDGDRDEMAVVAAALDDVPAPRIGMAAERGGLDTVGASSLGDERAACITSIYTENE